MKRVLCVISLLMFLLVGSVAVLADPHVVPVTGQKVYIIPIPSTINSDMNVSE